MAVRKLITATLALICVPQLVNAQAAGSEQQFPVEPVLFVGDAFSGCEGIAFNGEGRLFATCSTSATDRAFYEISFDGSTRKIAELDSTLGVAAIGDRDLLVADFGPTNAFRHDRNTDGVVWRISPEGDKVADSTGFGDPNFILVREDGSYLVSDDATADIYVVGVDKTPKLFSTAVSHPNGLAMPADGSVLYVAQIFSSIRPVFSDDRVWAIPLQDGTPSQRARVVARAGPNASVDGLAMDSEGRVYITANRAGKLWRYDPYTDEMTLLAEGMFGLASVAFGEGEFDRESVYGTTTFSQGRGGKIWRIPVGATAGRLYR